MATAALPAPRTAATHTETLGQLVNRLAVGWVRWNLLTEGGDQSGVRGLAQAAFQELGELSVAYDDLLSDLQAGRRRLPRCHIPSGPVAA